MGALGTNQMPGAICKFGTAYTLGKKDSNPINVTLLSAEYRATRVKTGKTFIFPKADTKLLVVKLTLQNPQSAELIYQHWIKFTAVTANGQNAEAYDAWIDAPPNGMMEGHLKPGQKIGCYAVIEVPGVGEVDKLILENRASRGSLVARYPLAGNVKAPGGPYFDPADRMTPLKVIKAQLGDTYEIDDADVSVLKVEQAEGDGAALERRSKDECYVLVTYKLTCQNEEGGWMTNFGGGWMYNQLTDADGSTYGSGNQNLRSTSIQGFDPRSNFGEPATFRKYYVVKRGVKLDYIQLKTLHSRAVRWGLGGFTTR